MDKQPLIESITLLETARKRLLDAHRGITGAPDGPDWELAEDVIGIARSVDEARCRLQDLLQNGSQSPGVQPRPTVKVGRRSRSDYAIVGGEFVKTGSTWEHKITKADFAKVIQSIKNIAHQSGAPKTEYKLDDVVKTTRVGKRYVYDVYTCLFELGLVDQQHRSIFYITKEEADALEIEDIWERIKRLADSQS